jgi:plasmid stabilization system protein ParE
VTLTVSPRAKAEAIVAARYYESQQGGLGYEFLSQLLAAFERIDAAPHASQRVRGRSRRAVMHQFPYCLVYLVAGDAVQVVGVISTRSDPCRILERAAREGSGPD